ncbi:DUF397 domain-containing protein [Streptomyces sp. NPDC017254]|uniref:DUF397 domain-containing protein n=1 Tax=unclassified Streptomyces TaxID=2593676 RepID=UPI0037A1AFAB
MRTQVPEAPCPSSRPPITTGSSTSKSKTKAFPVNGSAKSSYSDDGGGNCVEVAARPHVVHLRDSKQSDGPTFAVEPAAWSAFVAWQ